MSRHPSFLELDRLALGAPQRDDTRRHVETCAECGRYVRELPDAGAVPAWAATPAVPRRRRPPWALGLLGAASAAAALVLLVPRDPYVGSKGGPAVAVHVRRGEAVAPWDGRAVRPGDSVRLEVSPEGLAHVLVATERPGGALVELYRGRVERRGPLPVAWRVDEQGASETLVVVLSAAPRTLPELPRLLASPVAGVWSTRFVIPKEKR